MSCEIEKEVNEFHERLNLVLQIPEINSRLNSLKKCTINFSEQLNLFLKNEEHTDLFSFAHELKSFIDKFQVISRFRIKLTAIIWYEEDKLKMKQE